METPSATGKQDWRLLHLCSQHHVSGHHGLGG
jgi:hypothetical protein